MGTYMDAFIEVDHGNGQPPFCDPTQIHSLADGSFNLDRAYDVFDALAGGRETRMPIEDRDPRRLPLIPPRGMPEPCSPSVAQHYFYLICEAGEPPSRAVWPPWRYVSPAMASEWVSEKGSHQARFVQWINGSRIWQLVSEPDNYGATWLSLSEFDAALNHQGVEYESIPVCYRVIRSALDELVKHHGQSRVRLIIWFQ